MIDHLKLLYWFGSDSRSEKEDQSGKVIIDRLVKNGFEVVDYKVIRDEADLIESELKTFCDEIKVDIVITSGGTGIGPRDVTPEATKKVIQNELDGVAEVLRSVWTEKDTIIHALKRSGRS